MTNDLNFISDITNRIIKIVNIKLNEKSNYADNEIVFNVYNKNDKTAPPIEMSKKDIILILNDMKNQLKTNPKYKGTIKRIDNVLKRLN